MNGIPGRRLLLPAARAAHVQTLRVLLTAAFLSLTSRPQTRTCKLPTAVWPRQSRLGAPYFWFKRTDRCRAPYPALIIRAVISRRGLHESLPTICAIFCCLATRLGFLTWISILATHIRFDKTRRVQDVPDSGLTCHALLRIYVDYTVLVFYSLAALVKDSAVFFDNGEPFDYAAFTIGCPGTSLYLILISGRIITTDARGTPLRRGRSVHGQSQR
ncbi:hypothetical protein VUR80DRAFT_5720 [Thermomyces stellatus]